MPDQGGYKGPAFYRIIGKRNEQGKRRTVSMIYPEELEGAIEKIEEALRSTGELKYPSRWVALQLLEHDRHLEDEVSELANGKI